MASKKNDLYLCGYNNNKIEVFLMSPKYENALVDYRRNTLCDKPSFYTFETTSDTIMKRFKKGDVMDIRFLNYQEEWYAKLFLNKGEGLCHQQKIKDIQEKYINGEYRDVVPVGTFIPDGIDCFLSAYLPFSSVKETPLPDGKTLYVLEEILKLSKEAWALGYLQAGEFSEFLYWGCYEPLSLFNAIKVDEMTKSNLEIKREYGAISDEWYNQLDSSNSVYQKYKKIMGDR